MTVDTFQTTTPVESRPQPGEPLVAEVMTRAVHTIEVDTPLSDVIDTLIERGIACVPVVDEARHVVGIVTDTDLIVREAFSPLPPTTSPLLDELLRSHRNRWRQKATGAVARDVMSAPAATAWVDESVRAATSRMITMGRRHLPVVDSDGHLVGILTQRDVLRLLRPPVESEAGPAAG